MSRRTPSFTIESLPMLVDRLNRHRSRRWRIPARTAHAATSSVAERLDEWVRWGC